MTPQQTIARSVELSGIGLHTGSRVRVQLQPGPPDSGVVFRSMNQPALSPIRVLPSAVLDVRYATTLGGNSWSVATVEHMLAAVSSAGIDNLEVRVEGDEVPVVDGSAAPWLDLLEEAGRTTQERPRLVMVVRSPVEVHLGASMARLLPCPRFEISARIDFEHPLIGVQELELVRGEGVFGRELAWARTFGFVEEVEALRAMGLIQGGGLDNAVVYGPGGVVNPEGLRDPLEPVRHKMLDVVGDLSILGRPLRARYEANRPGHALNIALLRVLLARGHSWSLAEG